MHDRRVKLRATFTDAIAFAIFAVGCLCPIGALVNGGDLGFVHFLVVALLVLACTFVVGLSRLRGPA
jgi:hypothetical protein